MNVNLFPTIMYSTMMGVTLYALFNVVLGSKKRQSLFLGGLLLILLIHILGELFIYSGAYVYAPGLAGLQLPVRVLLGPALYFYAFATMSPDKVLTKKSTFMALLGPLIVVTIMVPFLLISPQDKLAMATPATRDPELFKIALFTCFFSMAIFITFTTAYLIATFKLQKQHRLQLMQRFSSIEKRSMDWIRTMLILWGGVWLLFTIEYTLNFLGFKWFGSGVIVPIFECLTLMTFSHYALKQPVLEKSDKAQPILRQTRTAQLPLSRMERIAKQLRQVMIEDKLFLEEGLSLKRLSDAISVSENHISETLSQHLNTNFFQLINGYRIEQAKFLLITSNDNVSTIAYRIGYNSKSTFNSAFKKETGTTPTIYRNQEKLLAS